VDGRNHYDETNLMIDLLETLLGSDAVEPSQVSIETAKSWFGADDQDVALEIIAELDSRPDAPFVWERSDGTTDHIYLTSREETLDFISELRENPPWYEKL